ncbi:MAG: hypothetical protein ACM3PT_08790 [Deltaproteobacteria bacterium]
MNSFCNIIFCKRYFAVTQIIVFSFLTSYSQQKVNYEITAELDVIKKMINAGQVIEYHNNSDTVLNEICLHLWANAFSTRTNSFSDKMLEAWNVDFYFLKPGELGGYSDIAIRQKHEFLEKIPVDKDGEIIMVKLKEPLQPGQSTIINIDYSLKIPKNILGFGFSESFYIMANWYPKVAVFEDRKWKYHQFNSSNLFFSDYANYRVTFLVPEFCTLVSSGKELEFPVNTFFKGKNSINNTQYKKFQYASDNVLDFTWIASPGILKKSRLGWKEKDNDNDKGSYIYIYYQESDNFRSNYQALLKAITDYTFFLNQNFPSPFPEQISIVIGEGIQVSNAFQDIITIEFEDTYEHMPEERDLLIKNLIKLTLGNIVRVNAPENPWLLDGMSSYYQTRFLNSFITDKSEIRHLQTIQYKIESIFSSCPYKNASHVIEEYWNNDKVFLLDGQTDINMNYLANRTGLKLFDTTMLSFFKKYKTSKIVPETLNTFLDTELKTDHSWFFQGVMKSKDEFRYSIGSFAKLEGKKKITVTNKGPFKVPYKLQLLDGKYVLESIEVPGHSGSRDFVFENKGGDKIAIDNENTIIKSQDAKSVYYTRNRLKNLQFFNFFRKFGPTNIILPMAGYNKHDGFLAGATIFGTGNKKFDESIFAFYGLKSKSLVGFFRTDLRLSDCCDNKIIEVGLSGASFHFRTIKDTRLRYFMISPKVSFVFSREKYNFDKLEYKFTFIGDQEYSGDGVKNYYRFLNRIDFSHSIKNVILTYDVMAGLEHQYYNNYGKRHYVMLKSEMNSRFMYKKDRYLDVRFYGATYLYNTHFNSTGTLPGTLSLIGYNINDYAYDHNLFYDRSAQDGFGIRQLTNTTGGFKTGISNSYGIGQSNKFIAALNLRMDLPFKFFVKPFFDVGVYGDLPTVAEGYSNKVLYSAGFLIDAEIFEIYIPFINSKEINNIYNENSNSFLDKISFSFKIKRYY